MTEPALNSFGNFFDWFESTTFSRPWLVVGKGPSFDRLNEVNLGDYHVIGLNHVMFKIPCLLGHAIDMDVYYPVQDKFMCRYLVTPWEPHVNFKPCGKSLFSMIHSGEAVLGAAALWYNSSRSKPLMIKSGPVVRVKGFSAVAAVNLLACAGVKEVFTVGVDGGTKYSCQFDQKTRLANGRASFDCQKSEFKLAGKQFGIKVRPLFTGGL